VHERAANRQRKAAERFREAGLAKAEEATKRVARDEEERAAAQGDQPRDRP
jgi:hypothetical protein